MILYNTMGMSHLKVTGSCNPPPHFKMQCNVLQNSSTLFFPLDVICTPCKINQQGFDLGEFSKRT